MENNLKIILGSESDERKYILEKYGYTLAVMPSGLDETKIRDDNPETLTIALAHAKADALLPQIKEPALLITSDYVIFCNNQLLEKPEKEAEARAMFNMIMKYPAYSFTAVAVTNTDTGKRAAGLDKAVVYFNHIPEKAVAKFISEGSPYTRAGAFSVRSPILTPYLRGIEGDIECVIGLPMSLTRKLMAKVQ